MFRFWIRSLPSTPRPRAPRRRSLFLEMLEECAVPAVVYVDDSLVTNASLASLGGRVTNDRDNSGTLTTGDQVTFALGEPGETTSLTFGQAAVGGDVGTVFGTGSPGGAIPAAITFATAGDTIQVARGNYAPSTAISINKSLTLLGAQAGVDPRLVTGTTRVVDSVTSESVIDAGSAGGAFTIAASNVTIDGFDVKASTTATTGLIDSTGSAFTNAKVRYNIIHNSVTTGSPGSKGIRLTAIPNSTVEYNHLFSVADTGIELGASASGASTDSTVQFNEVHDLGSGGTTNSAIYAFAVGSTATTINVTIKGNLVYNFNGNDAIKVGAKNGQDRLLTGGSVIDNIVHDTAQDGITIDASDTTVLRNEVYNSFSTNAAIYVDHGDNSVTVEDNYVHNNSAGLAAILVGFPGRPASPTSMVVSFNSIVSNSNNFVFFRDNTGGTAILDASANWYGSSAQATVAASVKSTAGSTATTNRIDFTPWLNNGTDADAMTPGFQPNFLGLTVAPSTVSIQTGTSGRIQEAIALAATGATIDVINGAYTENVSVNKDVTVNVAGTVTGKVSSTTDGKIVATGALSLGDGSATGVALAGSLSVGSQMVTLLDSDAAALDGATTIAGGTLTAANGISTASGGSLSGTGTVIASVTTAGDVLPGGASIGTLATGSVTLSSAATFAVDGDGGAADQLAVTGAVSLGGATLTLTVAAMPTVGQSFVIIDNDGSDAVMGNFAGLLEGDVIQAGGAFFQITYAGGSNANDVVLTTVTGVSITANDASAAETVAPAAANPGQFTVTRSGPTGSSLMVLYTVSGTATNGMDYAMLLGQVTIPAGQSSAVIDVSVINDALTEGDETVVLTLTPDPSYALGTMTSATVTIADNEPEVSISATDAAAAETVSPAAANPGQFTVTRTGDTSSALTVAYAVSGTATNGADYSTLSGSVTIPAGQSSATINVMVLNDSLTEGSETVVLTLSAGAYTLADPTSATVTIADNEPEVRVTATDPTAAESATPDPGRFTVTRTGDTTSALTVAYAVSGTATNGSDYSTLSGSVTIPAGSASADVVVSVINDALTEGNETVVLTLSAGAYTLADPTSATVTIADNQASVSITAADPDATESGAGSAASLGAFLISRTGTTVGPLTVSFTVGGSATNGVDYQFITRTAVIPDGQSQVLVFVTPIDDSLTEGDETVTLTLGPSANYVAGASTAAVVTIADNEQPVGKRHFLVVASGGQVLIFDPLATSPTRSFAPFADYAGPIEVASGDLNGDGLPDVVAAAGPGGPPHVKVFDGNTGALLASFYAFNPGFLGGVSVAVGDVNGDRVADLIVGAGPGADPHVIAIDGTRLGRVQPSGEIAPSALLASFDAFDPAFIGGVRVADGDVDGDGRAEVFVASRGLNNVALFSGDGVERLSFLVDGNDPFVAVGDRNNDGRAELLTSSGVPAMVRTFDGRSGAAAAATPAFNPFVGYSGPVSLAALDVNNDGRDELVAVATVGNLAHVKVFAPSLEVLDSFFVALGGTGAATVASR